MTTLHAGPTGILLHAEKSMGSANTVLGTFYLIEQNGNRLTEENGNYLTANLVGAALVLHARPTEILLHAGGSDG